MSFELRPRAGYLEALERVWTLEYPSDLRTQSELATVFNHVAEGAFEECWVADEATLLLIDEENKRPMQTLSVGLNVAPGRDDLHATAVEMIERTATTTAVKEVFIWTSDRPEWNTRLEAAGYSCGQVVPVSRLDIGQFDFERFLPAIARVENQGLRLVTAADLDEQGVDWRPQLHELIWEFAQDMPNTHPPTQMEYGAFCAMFENDRLYDRRLMFMACAGESLVGYSRVVPAQSMPGLALTGVSGAARAYRRRGIVRALKTKGILELRSRGMQFLQTDNDETNPMFRLNLELGFQPVWRYLEFGKRMAQPSLMITGA